MPKLVDLDSSSIFKGHKLTEVFIRKNGEDFKHHCEAIVLSEASDGFVIICAIPCLVGLGYSFHVRRFGFPHPVEISLSPEVSHIQVQEKDFGHVYRGGYQ